MWYSDECKLLWRVYARKEGSITIVYHNYTTSVSQRHRQCITMTPPVYHNETASVSHVTDSVSHFTDSVSQWHRQCITVTQPVYHNDTASVSQRYHQCITMTPLRNFKTKPPDSHFSFIKSALWEEKVIEEHFVKGKRYIHLD